MKRLVSSTIIPPELYVSRAADRQVRKVLDEMGRPGYVLVARQMGKTNLLLNAKRELQSSSLRFVYIDLTNPPPTARDCFRNIIDTAVSVDTDIFAGVLDELDRLRSLSLPAPKEHELELRALLRTFPGKLVIILDEVDALTKATFSDTVFAQIRATYFAMRVNFPEFYRLSYLLSGVAEPTQLIKDPKQSPFNIGEKIFLDDFGSEEFSDFLSRAGLELERPVADRIFHWTGGNPRMTWDVSSEVESISPSYRTVASIDAIVHHLYLEKFDVPPVDHIRALAASDREIRNAVMEIHYNYGASLREEQKNRLYLAGIVGSGERGNKFKNRIIEEALPTEWLKSLERSSTELVRMGRARLEAGDLREAETLFESALAETAPESIERQLGYFEIARAYYDLQRYQAAVDTLSKGLFNRDAYSALYYDEIHILAVCHFYLGNFARSIELFEEVVASGIRGAHYYDSMVNLPLAYLATAGNHRERVLSCCTAVLAAVESGEIRPFISDPEVIGRYETVARMHRARIYQDEGKKELARAEIAAALKSASTSEKALVHVSLAQMSDDDARRSELNGVMRHLMAGEYIICRERQKSPYQLTAAKLVDVAVDILDGLGSFDEDFFEWLRSEVSSEVRTRPALAVALGVRALSENKPNVARFMLDRAVIEAAAADLPASSRVALEAVRHRARLTPQPRQDGHRGDAVTAFINRLDAYGVLDDFSTTDLAILVNRAIASIQRGVFGAELDTILRVADRHRGKLSSGGIGGVLILDFIELQTRQLGTEARMSRARTLLAGIEEMQRGGMTSEWLDAENAVAIKRVAQRVLERESNRPKPSTHHEAERRYGRNDRVRVRFLKSGEVVETKFKKIVDDLRAGQCEIIEGE